MPIAYGQVKGRKYNNQQKLYKPKRDVKNKTCAKCGQLKPKEEFATRHFCKDCLDEIESQYIGGE